MLRHWAKLLLTLTFALLQCVAPLVHAHVDGNQTGVLPPYFSTQTHSSLDLLKSDGLIEEYESPAITVQDEFQRDKVFSLDQHVKLKIFVFPEVTAINIDCTVEHFFFSIAPYSTPPTQAPPVLG
jgi:hypothetical protein